MGYTIKDIAKKVGVSPSTVSRVINGTATISDETAQKIRQAMEEMNYHPNSMARSFATGLTRTIALVIDADNEKNFANSFFNRSVFAIEKQAQEAGFNLLIANGNKAVGISASQLVYEKKVDGLIIPPNCMNRELEQLLKKNDFPCVLLGKPKKKKSDFLWVDIDNRGGSRQAVEHLLKQGYKKPVLFIENESTVFDSERSMGYRESVAEDAQVVVHMEEHREDLQATLQQLLKRHKMDAAICSNNEMAYLIGKAIKHMGYNVPSEIGMVTFDNYPLAEYMEPPLSVVDVDTYTLGIVATKRLIDMIQKKELKEDFEIIPTGLIERTSTRKEG